MRDLWVRRHPKHVPDIIITASVCASGAALLVMDAMSFVLTCSCSWCSDLLVFIDYYSTPVIDLICV